MTDGFVPLPCRVCYEFFRMVFSGCVVTFGPRRPISPKNEACCKFPSNSRFAEAESMEVQIGCTDGRLVPYGQSPAGSAPTRKLSAHP